MTMLENGAAEVEDPEEGSSLVVAGGDAGGCLVLPNEVVASLAGQLAERARCGEPVRLTGPGGLLTGVIGQVLQAGLAAELDAHLETGAGVENRRNGTLSSSLRKDRVVRQECLPASYSEPSRPRTARPPGTRPSG